MEAVAQPRLDAACETLEHVGGRGRLDVEHVCRRRQRVVACQHRERRRDREGVEVLAQDTGDVRLVQFFAEEVRHVSLPADETDQRALPHVSHDLDDVVQLIAVEASAAGHDDGITMSRLELVRETRSAIR